MLPRHACFGLWAGTSGCDTGLRARCPSVPNADRVVLHNVVRQTVWSVRPCGPAQCGLPAVTLAAASRGGPAQCGQPAVTVAALTLAAVTIPAAGRGRRILRRAERGFPWRCPT